MRIAVLNWTVRRVGGTETYLAGIVPALQRRGHETAFWHEVDRPAQCRHVPILLQKSVAVGGEQ